MFEVPDHWIWSKRNTAFEYWCIFCQCHLIFNHFYCMEYSWNSSWSILIQCVHKHSIYAVVYIVLICKQLSWDFHYIIHNWCCALKDSLALWGFLKPFHISCWQGLILKSNRKILIRVSFMTYMRSEGRDMKANATACGVLACTNCLSVKNLLLSFTFGPLSYQFWLVKI